VPEDEHIEPGVRGVDAGLPADSSARLVHHTELQTAELREGDLSEAFSKWGAVVVAVAADDNPGFLLDPVEQAEVDPVAGVQHRVGGADRRPDLVRQVTCPSRDVGVGEQEQVHPGPCARRAR